MKNTGQYAKQIETLKKVIQACKRNAGIAEVIYVITTDALALPSTSQDILRQRDARVLRDAAAQFGSGDAETIRILNHMAGELENGK